MSKILRLLNISENTSLKNSLPLVAGMMDNKDLSKTISGQASRYSLAFFVPKFRLLSQSGDNKAQIHLPQFTGVNRHIYSLLHHGVIASYGGLIRPNKRPFTGNKSSRLVTVVETRPPFLSVGIQTTKLLGGHNRA